jgi:hypothetical protein
MDDTEDLDGWLGKPPEVPKARTPDATIVVEVDSDVHMSNNNLTDSNIGSPVDLQEDVQSEEDRNTQEAAQEVLLSNDENDIEADSSQGATSNVYVELPPLPDNEEDYEYLPGHYRVKHVMSEYKGERFLVQLRSGEADLVGYFLFAL